MARVLVVDDEEAIRKIVGIYAANDGHTVAVACDTSEARDLLQREAFDIVVSDIVLPRQSGVVLLAHIRETQPDIQVIMLTGEPEVGTAVEAVRQGAFDYLAKPVSREAISKVLTAAAAKKALLDRNRRLEEENLRHRDHLEELVGARTVQLRDSEARYRRLFTSIPDPIFVFAAESHRFLDCNQPALDRYGYTIEEVRTMSPRDLHPAEEMKRVNANIASGEDRSADVYTHITKDGERFPVEVLTTDLEYQGEAARISIVHDITERMRAQEDLRNSEERMRVLFEKAPDAYYLTDLKGVILDGNEVAEELTGYDRRNLVGKSFLKLRLLSRRQLIRAAALLAKNVLGESTGPDEFVLTRKNGGQVPVEIRTHPVTIQGRTLVLGIARDITERKQAQRETDRLLRQQVHINQLALALGHATGIDEIYVTVCERARDLLDVSAFIVSLYDEEAGLLTAVYAQFDGKPFDVSKLPPIPLEKKGHGTQSEVIHTGEPVYLPNFRKAREQGTTEYTVDDGGTVSEGGPPNDADSIARSALLVPLKLVGRTIGVMQIQSYQLDAYGQEDIDLLAGLANVSAVAVRNAQLVEEIEADSQVLQAALDGVIQALAATIETRDPYTAGHQQRVAELAGAIAREMGVPTVQQEAIRVASLLHDIGKISVPAEILSKPSKLTEVEFALIKAHSSVAHGILEKLDFPWPIAEIVLQHHERLDGSGYPHGLKGDAALLEARIITVADVVEAMSSHRPYRPALGIDAALHEISAQKGTLYDSTIVDACLALFNEKAFAFSEG